MGLLDTFSWNLPLIANYAATAVVILLLLDMVRSISLGMMADAFKRAGMAFIVFGLVSVMLSMNERLNDFLSAKAGPDFVVQYIWTQHSPLEVISFTLIGTALLVTGFVMQFIAWNRTVTVRNLEKNEKAARQFVQDEAAMRSWSQAPQRDLSHLSDSAS